MTTIRVCQETDAVCAFQNVCDADHCVRQFYPAAPKPAPSPVRTVTRKEIVPGKYGRMRSLNVDKAQDATICIGMDEGLVYKPDDLREFASLLTEIADAMEETAK